ncbi:MAG: MATE family efflux transporter [Defluviitaleaceae bacterium]|nr:MATE family efflux transporter [Defluviitaleaceae bacterium]
MFKDLSKENRIFYKRMLQLAPPVIMSELLNSLVNILDTVMIGRAMGIQEVTAVALSNQVFFMYVMIFWGVVSGCGVFIGQYFGKGEMHNIQKTVGLGLTLSLCIALVFFIPSFFFPQFVISIFSQDPYVIEVGARFLRTLSLCYFFVAITFTRNGCMRNTGQTKIPMLTTAAALTLNFIFNYILIFVFAAPLEWVAMGTVLARFAELCLQQYFIRRFNIPIRGNLKQYMSYNMAFIKQFFKVSIFIILGLVVFSVGTTAYNVAYAFAGTDAQGAIKISTSMMQLFMVFGMSFGVFTQIIMTNTLGSGNRELAIRYSRKCMVSVMAISSVMAVLLIIFAPIIVLFFDADEQVSYYVLRLIYVYAGGMILRGTNFVNLAGIIRSGGDTRFTFIVDIIAVWFIGVPIAFITAAYFGLPIYWVVFFVHMDEIFKFVVSIFRVLSNKWANRIV